MWEGLAGQDPEAQLLLLLQRSGQVETASTSIRDVEYVEVVVVVAPRETASESWGDLRGDRQTDRDV